MELKEGMYVRTKEGYIAKFIKEEKYLEDGETIETTSYQFDHNIDKYSDCVNYAYAEDVIAKEPSFDIIDLIEAGDYVNGAMISQSYLENIKYLAPEIKESNFGIKSIVTKEQFESMSYKVGE